MVPAALPFLGQGECSSHPEMRGSGNIPSWKDPWDHPVQLLTLHSSPWVVTPSCCLWSSALRQEQGGFPGFTPQCQGGDLKAQLPVWQRLVPASGPTRIRPTHTQSQFSSFPVFQERSFPPALAANNARGAGLSISEHEALSSAQFSPGALLTL